jgi:L-ascorbate metabolism protein UlaG (beta-lactamase superfamily)
MWQTDVAGDARRSAQFSFEPAGQRADAATMKPIPVLSFQHLTPAAKRFAVSAACLWVAFANPLAVGAATALAGDVIPAVGGDLIVRPINHATLALQASGRTIFVDPVGGAARFANLPRPDLILITDIHGDHLDLPTLQAVATEKTLFVAPPAVAEKLPAELRSRTTVLANGQSNTMAEVTIEAIPAYNLAEDRQKYHAKGRGNGYLLTLAGKRVYVSGDTEDIPEMRALRKVDVAFVCMNLPYTMTVDQAARAVREFKPKIVYPYHYRGSDLEKFKQLVGGDPGIEVRVRDWYQP